MPEDAASVARARRTASSRARPIMRLPRAGSTGPASTASVSAASGASPMRMTGTPASCATSQPCARQSSVSSSGHGA